MLLNTAWKQAYIFSYSHMNAQNTTKHQVYASVLHVTQGKKYPCSWHLFLLRLIITVIVCLRYSLVKRDLWVVYFHNYVQQSYLNLICVCFVVPYVYVCVHFCKCVCVITHAVISGRPPFTLAEMKGFPLSQSSFFVSMVLWFCQNPKENRGGRKKINVPHHQQQSQPSRLPPYKYTLQHMHTHTVGNTKSEKSCPCAFNLFIFPLKEVDNSKSWIFLIIAGECLKR